MLQQYQEILSEESELAPYCLFSVKALGRDNKVEKLRFHDGKNYTDLESTHWEVKILLRNDDQHALALKCCPSLSSTTLQNEIPKQLCPEDETKWLKENLSKSIHFYYNEIELEGGKCLNKKYIRHSSVFDKFISNFKEDLNVFSITRFQVECNSLECIINVQITRKDNLNLHSFYKSSPNSIYEIGFDFENKSIDLFRIHIKYKNNLIGKNENMYQIMMRYYKYPTQGETWNWNSSIEFVNSFCKKFQNSNGITGIEPYNEFEKITFSKPYLHIILLQAICEFITSCSGLRIGLMHFKSIEDALFRINSLRPLINECTVLRNYITRNDENVKIILENVFNVKIPTTRDEKYMWSYNYNTAVSLRFIGRFYTVEEKKVNQDLFKCKRKLIPIFPRYLSLVECNDGDEIQKNSVLGIYHCLLTCVKCENIEFDSEQNIDDIFEYIFNILFNYSNIYTRERFYYGKEDDELLTELESRFASSNMMQLYEKDQFISELQSRLIKYAWKSISVPMSYQDLIQIDNLTCQRYLGYMNLFRHYYLNIKSSNGTDLCIFDFLLTSFDAIVRLICHLSSCNISTIMDSNILVVNLICFAENMSIYLEELFERFLTVNQILDLEIGNLDPRKILIGEITTTETHMDRVLLDLLKGNLNDNDIYSFLNSLCQECVRFNSTTQFSTLSNISILMELVRHNTPSDNSGL